MASKPRMNEAMITRLVNIERRLDALTDTEDGGCAVEPDVKDAVRPYVGSWVKPDVKALLAWARGEQTVREVDYHFPMSRAHARMPRFPKPGKR